jgi:hypothetical protein
MLGYNPNRDDGVAPNRSFIEIPSSLLPEGLIQEYDQLPEEKRRYFAQVVYMVPINSNVVNSESKTDSLLSRFY